MLKARVLVFAVLLSTAQVRAHDGDRGNRKWVASWATSPATFYTYVAPPQPFVLTPGVPIQYAVANIQPDLAFPFPNATTTGAAAVNQTFRSMVKPDLWGNTIRIRFSNIFGTTPVTFENVTVGLQDYSANVVAGTPFPPKIRGEPCRTIPPSLPFRSPCSIAPP